MCDPAGTVVKTPTFDPAEGNVSSGTSITISCATDGATIYYTTDGTAPTTTSGIEYADSFTISATTTVKAIGIKDGLDNSEVATAVYTVSKVEAPVASKTSGSTVYSGTKVTFACGTDKAQMFYTDDGTTPTASSTAVPTDGITITKNVTLKVIAILANYDNSDVTTAEYKLNVENAASLPSAVSALKPKTTFTSGRGEMTDDEDLVEYIVEDPISQDMKLVNYFLNLMKLTGFDETTVVDKGDVNVSFTLPPFPGQQRDRKNKTKVIWVVNTKTQDDGSFLVNAWGDGKTDEGRVKLQIKAIAFKPNGGYELYVKLTQKQQETAQGRAAGSGEFSYLITVISTIDPVLKTEDLQLEITNETGDVQYYWSRIKTDFSTDGADTGQAKMLMFDPESDAEYTYEMNFNGDYGYIKISKGEETLGDYGIKRADPGKDVWSYGLYNKADESRVLVRTGMTVEVTDDANAKYVGWADNWGVFAFNEETYENVTVADGDTITEFGDDGSAGDTYTVEVVPGRLYKNTQIETTLTDIEGIPFVQADYSGETPTFKKVKYNSTNNNFEVEATRSGWDQPWTDVAGQTIDLPTDYMDLYFIADQSKSIGIFKDDKGTTEVDDDIYEVTVYQSEEVEGLTDDLTLYPYDNIPTTTIFGQSVGGMDSADDCNAVIAADDINYVGNEKTFQFNKDTLILERLNDAGDGYDPVTFTDAVSDGECYVGLLLPEKLTGEGVEVWDAYAAEVSYTWETGTEDWYNKYFYKNNTDNTYEDFDDPIRIPYKTNEGYYELEYYGFGDLYVPWAIYNEVDGELVEISESEWMDLIDDDDDDDVEFKPKFTVPDATEITVGTNTYVVKHLLVEEIPAMLPSTNTNLEGLKTIPALNNVSGIAEDPALGTRPDVKTPPVNDEGYPVKAETTAQ